MKFRNATRALAPLCLALAASPVLATTSADIAALTAVLSNYNVYVDGNFGTASNPYTSDSQGAMAIGGNAWLTSFSAGTNLTGGTALTVQGNLSLTNGSSAGAIAVGGNATFSSMTVGAKLSAGATALTVGGNLTASNGTINGNTVVAGTTSFLNANSGSTVNGNLTLAESSQGASLPTHVAGTTTYNQSVTAATAVPSITSNFQLLKQASTDLATSLLSAGAKGTVSNYYGQLDLTGTAAVNYFSLTASQLVGINGLDFLTPVGSTTIIDVTGQFTAGATITNYGFLGNDDPTHVLFNFVDATKISINGIGFGGSILAPNAEIDAVNGNFNGTVIANSFGSVIYNDAEFHEDAFTGTINTPVLASNSPIQVPEPGSVTLLMAGFASLMVLVARRRGRIGAKR